MGKRMLGILLALWMLATVGFAAPAWAESLTDGAQLFEIHCVGCHVNGGNIVRRGKTLKQKALEKNQMDTLAAVEAIVTHGKGVMSAYENRLTPAEIEAVSAYVLERAAHDWKPQE